MLTDAHCHIFDLVHMSSTTPGMTETGKERCFLPCAATRAITCAASAWNKTEFEFHEQFARLAARDAARLAAREAMKASGVSIVLCFAVHPQLPAVKPEEVEASLETLYNLAAGNRLRAIGETGFDLFNAQGRPAGGVDYRMTEKVQEELFNAHLDLAAAKGLPLVLHLRRAMNKVFAYSKQLKKLPSVILHSYSGTYEDGQALLRRGINAYFSFGTPILLNHKTARSACARLPLGRLLSETDAPYQPLRKEPFSHWGNLPAIVEEMARLREEPVNTEDLMAIIEDNFQRAYGCVYTD
ncbi:MAG: TatD family hydrolase [Treponema sp.]|jgi:TatD DNase family protein|nr:TatD family hydrolase [Treponema sp.]